jgi:crotonobetainyl-CoA:carnitine CoA-transferase CaiB-like acyl-CoA transferase
MLDSSSTPPPLAGLIVLDLSRVLAGPYCTMVLGDLGADVIKIEHPDGDDTRRWGPPFAAGESAYYLAVNRNKRSVVADLKTPAGRELVRRIARRADIVVENFRPGTLERFGLGLDGLRAENPRLITLTISGMGATGPDSDQPGYDFIVQAMGGLMSITGPAAGPPSKVGVAVVDLTTGMMAANAILAALYARERTGTGQHIETSLLETQVAWLANVASAYLITGEDPVRHGNAHPTIVPYQTFRASDTEFALGVGNDAQWRRLCDAIGRPELADEERFSTNPARIRHRIELASILDELFAAAPASYWVGRIREAGIPAGPVRTVPEVLEDPQVHAREMVVSIEHPRIGELRLVGIPFKFSMTPASIRRPPPLLGEHTEEVEAEYGAGRGTRGEIRGKSEKDRADQESALN